MLAVVNLFAFVAYTKLLKGLPGVGNAVVGYLTGSTFLLVFVNGTETGSDEPSGASLSYQNILEREMEEALHQIADDEWSELNAAIEDNA